MILYIYEGIYMLATSVWIS